LEGLNLKNKEKNLKLIEPVVGEEELQAIQKVLESGWLTEGPVTREFEERIAQFTGAKHAIAVTNCTVAIEIALRALQIKRGDEVIVPDFTHPATADAVSWVGADPVLVDVGMSSYNVDMDEVEKAKTEKTKCLIAVSWGGNPLDFRLLSKFKKEHELYTIEDAACSLGSEFAGKKTGTMADITCFSFHPRKIITTGEGGMIATDDDALAERIRLLKKFGMKSTGKKDEFIEIGNNYKLCDILGAMGVAQMNKIHKIIERRIELAESYTRLLENCDFIRPPKKDENAKHVYQTYAIYVEIDGIRDKIIQDLKKEGIETQIGTYALHLQKAFENVKAIGELKTAEKLYRNLLTLPMYHSMSLKNQELVVRQISKSIERHA
jgi:dTDP-4-amino-4,6-dideoxygalactose transaminase